MSATCDTLDDANFPHRGVLVNGFAARLGGSLNPSGTPAGAISGSHLVAGALLA